MTVFSLRKSTLCGEDSGNETPTTMLNTSARHPNGQTDSHANILSPLCPSLYLFLAVDFDFFFFCSWAPTHHSATHPWRDQTAQPIPTPTFYHLHAHPPHLIAIKLDVLFLFLSTNWPDATQIHDMTIQPNQPPRPPFQHGSCKKVLPCPGNIVGGAKCCPMTLSGHGSTLLQLTHWHYPCLSPPFATQWPPSHQRHWMSQNMQVGKIN